MAVTGNVTVYNSGIVLIIQIRKNMSHGTFS